MREADVTGEPFIHLYMAPVWTGAFKIGRPCCGYCGAPDHDWLDCERHRCKHGLLAPFTCCCPHGTPDRLNCELMQAQILIDLAELGDPGSAA